MNIDILPSFASKKCSSLKRLGFTGTFSGLPCRPVLPNSVDTMHAVSKYIYSLGGSDTFHLPLSLLSMPLPSYHGDLAEVPLDRRVKNWFVFVKRKKRTRLAAEAAHHNSNL